MIIIKVLVVTLVLGALGSIAVWYFSPTEVAPPPVITAPVEKPMEIKSTVAEVLEASPTPVVKEEKPKVEKNQRRKKPKEKIEEVVPQQESELSRKMKALHQLAP